MTDNDNIKTLGCQASLDTEITHVHFKDVVNNIINFQQAEIDSLKKEKDYLNSIIYDFVEQVPYYETNAIKKFAAKVNEMSLHTLDDEYMIWKSKFDEILKEMVVSIK